MAPYVPQWYAALGTQESRYIIYKVGGVGGGERGGVDWTTSQLSGPALVCWPD